MKEKRKDRSEHPARDTQARKKGSASELTLLCVGAAAAANAACSAAPVRPMPAPEACPAGAVKVMTARFHIPIGGMSPGFVLPGADYSHGRAVPIPVREGPVTILHDGPWNNMPIGTHLYGRLVFGPERVYGRFTEARLPDGEIVPVCFAMVTHSPGKHQGVPIRGTGGPGTAVILPFVGLEPVRSLE